MSKEVDIFLEKGLLEQYAMGHCTPEEEREVEAMLKQSEVVRKEYAEIQFYLEKLSATKARPLPDGLLASIEDQIDNQAAPKVVPIKKKHVSGFAGWKIAASIALLLATGLILQQWNKNQNLQARIDMLEKRQDDLETEAQMARTQLASLQDKAAFIEHSRTEKLILNTSLEGQEFVLAAYWNDFAEKALLDPKSIPAPPKGKCYQLWADVHGEMVPVAIITKEQLEMLEGRFYQEAESLNVTIEEAGGSDHATVENLVTSIEV